MVSIIYSNRNRDVKRIKASLESLQRQSVADFEVIFVDYGSDLTLTGEYKELLSVFSFVKFFPLEVSQLLWNKSRALNFGIKRATFPYIFIADVDLIFHPASVDLFHKLANPEKFFLFKLGYLGQKESKKLNRDYRFEELKPERFGQVNGMILADKEALVGINGLDEFFHFYGAEDEDLFARLENAGYKRILADPEYFYHNWHRSFSGSQEKLLTGNPRVKNIMRINQRHFLRNRERCIQQPLRQKGMGELISPAESDLLKKPSVTFRIPNILAHVEHFLREELPSHTGSVVEVEFLEDSYYRSLKHKLKRFIGKQTQPYCSLKEVNDRLLKEILFLYREHNYSLKIAEDLKSIRFSIKL